MDRQLGKLQPIIQGILKKWLGKPCFSALQCEVLPKSGGRSAEKRASLRIRQRLLELAAGGVDAPRVSLTHSQGVALGVVVSHARVLQVGIDLEARTRTLSEAAVRRVFSPHEREWDGLLPIIGWTLKEAAFKADEQAQGQPVTLPQYLIKSWSMVRARGTSKGAHLVGHASLTRKGRRGPSITAAVLSLSPGVLVPDQGSFVALAVSLR